MGEKEEPLCVCVCVCVHMKESDNKSLPPHREETISVSQVLESVETW